jgi:hypothetical protein
MSTAQGINTSDRRCRRRHSWNEIGRPLIVSMMPPRAAVREEYSITAPRRRDDIDVDQTKGFGRSETALKLQPQDQRGRCRRDGVGQKVCHRRHVGTIPARRTRTYAARLPAALPTRSKWLGTPAARPWPLPLKVHSSSNLHLTTGVRDSTRAKTGHGSVRVLALPVVWLVITHVTGLAIVRRAKNSGELTVRPQCFKSESGVAFVMGKHASNRMYASVKADQFHEFKSGLRASW